MHENNSVNTLRLIYKPVLQQF